MSKPANQLPPCSFLLRLLPASSAYDSPCAPPSDGYVKAAHETSFAKLCTYFEKNDLTHVRELKKCVVKHMPREDWSAMHALAESAYKRAKDSEETPATTISRR